MPTPSLTLREATHRAQRSSAFIEWGKFRTYYKSKDSFLNDAAEKHFTPSELAEQWKLSPETIRRLFQDEPGVLKMPNAGGPSGKRRYKTLRIPASVAARLHRRLSA